MCELTTEIGIPEKRTHLGTDGAPIFTGVHNGVNVQFMRNVPFGEWTHCLNHREALCLAKVCSRGVALLMHVDILAVEFQVRDVPPVEVG